MYTQIKFPLPSFPPFPRNFQCSARVWRATAGDDQGVRAEHDGDGGRVRGERASADGAVPPAGEPALRATGRHRRPTDRQGRQDRARQRPRRPTPGGLQPTHSCRERKCAESYNKHTRARLTALFPGLPGWAVTRRVGPKTNLDFTEARDSEWRWYQLGHMQVCTSLQTNNHARTPPLKSQVFYRPDALPAAQPTASKQRRQQNNNKFMFKIAVSILLISNHNKYANFSCTVCYIKRLVTLSNL